MKRLITAGLIILALVAGYTARPTVDKVIHYTSLITKASAFKKSHERAFLRCDSRCEAYNATWKPQYESMLSEARAVFN